MNQNEIETQVRETVSAIMGYAVPGDASRPNEGDWDSLKHMQIVFAIEERFSLQFSEEEIPDLVSIKHLVTAVRRKKCDMT